MKTNELDTYAGAYNDDFAYALDNELMLNWYPKRILNRVKKGSLLELGIGHGYTTTLFSKTFSRHVVLDGSKDIIAKFKENNSEIQTEIIETYFEEFETTEKFDVIIMGFILEHVDDPELILKKYRNFLSDDGVLFITVPNSEALNKRFGFLAGIIEDTKTLTKADLELGHKRIYDLDSLRAVCIKSGYTIVKEEGIFLKPITTNQIKTLKLSKEILEAMLIAGIDYPELCAAMLVEAKKA